MFIKDIFSKYRFFEKKNLKNINIWVQVKKK